MGAPSVGSHQATGGELYSGIAQSCARLTGQTSGLPQILSYEKPPRHILIGRKREVIFPHSLSSCSIDDEHQSPHVRAGKHSIDANPSDYTLY
jgi:hypothetical protein